MKIERPIYGTSDLNLAAALLAKGISIIGIDPSNPDRVRFLFDKKEFPNIDKLISEYWNDKMLVNPKNYMNVRRDLLARVFESKRRIKLED